jgi:twinkle protein
MTMSDATLRWLDARGLDVELADRLGFDGARREGGEALVIPFKRDGQVVRRKYKLLAPPPGVNPYTQDKGGVRCAWNEDVLREARFAGRPLIITEGELDALAAIQCGFERTISVPDGAPPPGERSKEDLEEGRKYAWVADLKPLLGKDHVPEIILATDGDENGAALLQDLSVLLGRYRCKFLRYPKAPQEVRERLGRHRCKDLNEVLQFYGLKGVVETISRAEWLQVDGVYRMSELPPVAVQPVYDIGFGDHFKLRPGDFSVWTGIPSHGKSTFLNDVMCRVVERHGLTIAWASFEQRPQTDHRRYLRTWFLRSKGHGWTPAAIEEADAWIDRHHVFLYPKEDDDVTLDWFLEKAEVAVVRHGAKVVVGDPWNEMDHEYDMRAMTEAQYINGAIKELRRFARAFQVHLAIVAHPTKLQKQSDGKYPMPTLYDINGGAVWHNKADLGVIVHRETEDDTRVKTAKSRYHDIIGKPGSVLMQFCADDRRFRETERGLL